MALIKPAQFTTKSGRQVILRNPNESDAEALLEINRAVIREGDSHVTEIDEYHTTLQEQRAWIERYNKASADLALVAEVGSSVVGFVEFHSHPNLRRLQHMGSLSIAIAKEFRNEAIGRLLMLALLDWAKAHPVIEKINLLVFSTNTRAIHLYKSLGFLEEGRRRGDIKISEGNYIDDVMMGRRV